MVHADRAARVLPPRAGVAGGGRVAPRLARAGGRDVLRAERDPREQASIPSIHPKTPEDYGVPESQSDVETRQYRNVVRTWQELKLSKHPLNEKDPAYRFVFQTPEVPLGRALDRRRLGLDRDALRPLRRPVPPRRPHALDGRGLRGDQPARRARARASRTATTSGSTQTPTTARTAARRSTDEFYEVARVMMRVRDLLGDAARRDPHVVQHVRGDAGDGRRRRRTFRAALRRTRRRATSRSSGTAATSRDARVPAPDADDRLDEPQGVLRPGDRHRVRGGRPLALRRAEGGASSRSRRPRTAARGQGRVEAADARPAPGPALGGDEGLPRRRVRHAEGRAS